MLNSRRILAPIMLVTAAFVGGAAAAEYQIDTAHSSVGFRIRHMGLSWVDGGFEKFGGTFDVDPKNVKATKGSAVIQVASINTGNAKRDGHLRSDDFFDVAKFPEIRFTSKEVKDVNEKDSTATLVGDLTMHGVTKPITLKVKGSGILANDGWGNERAAFNATGKINRFDYGLKWNKALETGSLVAGNEVEIILSFEGLRPLAQPAGKPASPEAVKKGQEKAVKEEAKPAAPKPAETKPAEPKPAK